MHQLRSLLFQLQLKFDAATDASRQVERRIWQSQAHAEGTARRIEHAIDNGHNGRMGTANRRFRRYQRFATHVDLSEECRWKEDFDEQGVHFGEREDGRLLVPVLAWNQESFDDDAVDRTV